MSIGTSTAYSLEWIVARMREINPCSILDVGCGSGRWGVLAREFLEIWQHRYHKPEWRVFISGLDVHPGTWTPLHRYIYDQMIELDVRQFTPAPEGWDLAIACDVLEHLPKVDAQNLLATLRARCPHVLVGIPLGPGWLHPSMDDNPYSAHVSEWTEDDFDGAHMRKVLHEEQGLLYGLFAFRRS